MEPAEEERTQGFRRDRSSRVRLPRPEIESHDSAPFLSDTAVSYAVSGSGGPEMNDPHRFDVVVGSVRHRALAAALLLGLAGCAGADQELDSTTPTGTLEASDAAFSGGEYFDRYEVDVQIGQTLVADLQSDVFNPYVVVRSPSGQEWANDDFEGSRTLSRLEIDALESGTWEVIATSYAAKEVGAYVLDYQVTGEPSSTVDGARVESGTLDSSDVQLEAGEYRDVYTVTALAGQVITADMRSSDFDTYVFLRNPANEGPDNDDFEGDRSRSVVSYEVLSDGEHQVYATSYQPGETGAYSLAIRVEDAPGLEPRFESGALTATDDTIRSGEYVDAFQFEGRPGDRVDVRLTSTEFDPYLIVLGPAEDRGENDDDGESTNARVDLDLTESGTYYVLVTSYGPGEVGAYELVIDQSRGVEGSPVDRDLTELAFGIPVGGTLSLADARLDPGKYRDLYAFEATPGEMVTVEMRSTGFDPYLIVMDPSGNAIENDDWEGDRTYSRIDLPIEQSGRYRVLATSYAAETTGAYEIGVSRTGSATPADRSGGGGRVFGVFVGISDYPGEINDLAYTAEDAHRIANALVAGSGMQESDYRVLTDAEATRENVFEAVRSIGSRAGPDDTFVFFYSGHGDRLARAVADAADPDALDETIELYDATVRDDEFGDLLDEIQPGTLLLLLDACFSGGFSKDIISVPGRMGLFSSEEDVTSSVAAKFRAGGFLSLFAADAIADRLADADGDRMVTALEFSQYIHERYRSDVKSGGPDDYVRTGGPQTGYQHLVVDRGGISPHTVLFR